MDFFGIVAPALFVAFGAFFLYRMFRHGGLRGAMFGARVVRAVGEVSAESQGPVRVVLKVHLLERTGSDKLVGLELVAKSLNEMGVHLNYLCNWWGALEVAEQDGLFDKRTIEDVRSFLHDPVQWSKLHGGRAE